jgi:signal transduction histidine kinase
LDEAGSDAGTARLIGKRGRIAAGRVLLSGDDSWSGLWLADAEPEFRSNDGVFTGYRGALRRPTSAESAAPMAAVTDQSALSADVVRQLVHELRSPINAISGFAQLIEGQFAGPVAATYRGAAQAIIDDALALIASIDEIDLLARPFAADASGQTAPDANAHSLLTSAMARIVTTPGRLAPPYTLDVLTEDSADMQLVEADEVLRILALIMRPLAAALNNEQQVAVELSRSARLNRGMIAFELPPQLRIETDGDYRGMPGLGFGFAAARRAVEAIGGTLEISANQYILNIPAILPCRLAEDQAR